MASLNEIRLARSEMQAELRRAQIYAKDVVSYMEREWELREEAIRQEQRKSNFLRRSFFIIKKWIFRFGKRNIRFDENQND